MTAQAAAAEDPVSDAYPSQKDAATTRARFALLGHALIANGRNADGQDSWVVSRWGFTRTFTAWSSVLAFLEQIGGQP